MRTNPSYSVLMAEMGKKAFLVGRRGGRSSTQNLPLYKREGKAF